MGWLKEFNLGEYFSDVAKSFKKLITGTGEMVGETAGGVVGGVLKPIGAFLKKIWFLVIAALIIGVLLLTTKAGKKIIGRFFK